MTCRGGRGMTVHAADEDQSSSLTVPAKPGSPHALGRSAYRLKHEGEAKRGAHRRSTVATSPRQCRNSLNGVQESNQRDSGHNIGFEFFECPVRIRSITRRSTAEMRMEYLVRI
jgi:hypothetical protein